MNIDGEASYVDQFVCGTSNTLYSNKKVLTTNGPAVKAAEVRGSIPLSCLTPSCIDQNACQKPFHARFGE